MLEDFKKEMVGNRETQHDGGLVELRRILFQHNQTFNAQISNLVSQ